MSDSQENTNYEQIINRAIDFSIFLQKKLPMGILVKEKRTNLVVKININALNIHIDKEYKTENFEPVKTDGHYQEIAGLDWNTELSEKIENKLENPDLLNAFHVLNIYNMDTCDLNPAITYLQEQLKNSSINDFYKNVLTFILKQKTTSKINKNCVISGGKSRRRRRKTNKKKTRKAKKKTNKKTNKKKRKGNKKRKTRTRRRKH